jgi:hypothetical protein
VETDATHHERPTTDNARITQPRQPGAAPLAERHPPRSHARRTAVQRGGIHDDALAAQANAMLDLLDLLSTHATFTCQQHGSLRSRGQPRLRARIRTAHALLTARQSIDRTSVTVEGGERLGDAPNVTSSTMLAVTSCQRSPVSG